MDYPSFIYFCIGFLTSFSIVGGGLACIALTKAHRNRMLIRRVEDQLHEDLQRRTMKSH